MRSCQVMIAACSLWGMANPLLSFTGSPYSPLPHCHRFTLFLLEECPHQQALFFSLIPSLGAVQQMYSPNHHGDLAL